VIVPLYNKARYIERALRSIANQSFSDFEVIVVDDGSTDESAAIARDFPDNRLRVIQQRNSGPGAARNRGIAEARGHFVASLDADDEWEADFLQQAVAALSATAMRDAACWSSCYSVCPPGESTVGLWQARGLRSGRLQVSSRAEPIFFLHVIAFMSPCTTVARTEVIRELGGYYDVDGCRNAEDTFLWLQVALRYPIGIYLEPLVRIHRDASELSNNLGRPRPLEPFLEHPELIERQCPAELLPLLRKFYVIRAFKTACFQGYWGDWRAAAAIRRRFRTRGDWALPYFTRSLICSTPLGAILARLVRYAKALR
jgi:hypothetical protein